jgi:hypothetical protein
MIEESLIKNPLLLAVLPALIVAFVNYLSASTSKVGSLKASYYEKRFLDFYHPAFRHLESYLFKEISRDEVVTIYEYLNKMIEDHHMLINDRIIDRHRLMKIHLESNKISPDTRKSEYLDDFYSICRHLDADITFLQNKLGLPTRGFIYRFNHRQLTFASFFYGSVLTEFLDSFVIPYLFLLAIIFLMYYFGLI